MRFRWLSLGLITTTSLLSVACGSDDDDGSPGSGGTAGTGASGGSGGTAASGGTGASGGTAGMAGSGGSAGSASVSFVVRIENVSNTGGLPTPVSPGVWAVGAADTLFSADMADRGEGLEGIAEDADPTALAASLGQTSSVAGSDVFNTPQGGSMPGPALPGGAYEFTITASPGDGTLFFASMFGQSNDVFIAPDGAGIALFDANGSPLAERDVTASVKLWDAGTEQNQAPGAGPDQAPRQAGPNTGPAEGVVSKFSSGTRAMPLAASIARVTVSENAGSYTVKLMNMAGTESFTTPIAPVAVVTHAVGTPMFGTTASAGLEKLAEDAAPGDFVNELSGQSGIGSAEAITIPDGASSAGPIMPGDSFTLTVTPSMAAPQLNFACMVGQSNDAFLALPPAGVALLDSTGAMRSAAEVEADINRMLAIWDAGTEANEVPGVGPNQAPRQSAENTGPADSDTMVRRYNDSTNDLEGPSLGGFAGVSVINGASAGDFVITVSNTSASTVYPGLLSPVAWAVHDSSATLFATGMPAPDGIEHVAEDGNATPLATALSAMSGVGSSGVESTPDGGSASGPLMPGDKYTFTVTADASHPFLSIACMVAPSNDTFMAFEPSGIALLDSQGMPRSNMDIAADIVSQLSAWDAGTEENQTGAAGPDQPPRQAAADTGAGEGNGFVRELTDPVWAFPSASAVVRVTIKPQ